jgi:hypothetical protein
VGGTTIAFLGVVIFVFADTSPHGAGRADLHYGNNVATPHHHRYTITVTCNGQRATFHITSP